MNMRKKALTTAVTLAIGLGGSAALVQAENNSASRSGGPDHSRAQNEHMGNDISKASRWLGREVNDRDGKEIGSIEDIAINARSGEVEYAVIEVGGGLFDASEGYLAVPLDAFEMNRGEEITLAVATSKWQQAEMFDEDEWPSAPTLIPSDSSMGERMTRQTGEAASRRQQKDARDQRSTSARSGQRDRQAEQLTGRELFRSMDENGDGRVSREEFASYEPEGFDLRGERLAFSKVNEGEESYLSQEELIGQLDENDDGVIWASELHRFVTRDQMASAGQSGGSGRGDQQSMARQDGQRKGSARQRQSGTRQGSQAEQLTGRELFRQMDENGDGRLSREEFASFEPSGYELQGDPLAFRSVNQDGDSYLTREELMNRLDENGDGVIWASELHRFVTRTGSEGGARRSRAPVEGDRPQQREREQYSQRASGQGDDSPRNSEGRGQSDPESRSYAGSGSARQGDRMAYERDDDARGGQWESDTRSAEGLERGQRDSQRYVGSGRDASRGMASRDRDVRADSYGGERAGGQDGRDAPMPGLRRSQENNDGPRAAYREGPGGGEATIRWSEDDMAGGRDGMKTRFAALDSNVDGLINESELMDELDRDGNGRISREEFVSFEVAGTYDAEPVWFGRINDGNDRYLTQDELMQALDDDGDGRIAREEFGRFRAREQGTRTGDDRGSDAMGRRTDDEARGRVTRQRQEVSFRSLDADGDGYSSRSEVLDAVDRNGDGSISRREFTAFELPGLDPDEHEVVRYRNVRKDDGTVSRRKLWDELDDNGDGQLSRSEFASFQEKQQRERSSGREDDEMAYLSK